MASDFETQLRGIEDRLMKLDLASILARLAALEQGQWQLAGGLPLSANNIGRPIVTPSGGIPASSGTVSGSAVCQFYDVDPATGNESTAETDTVFNFFTVAVGASKRAYAVRAVNSNGLAVWVATSEQCP